MWYYKIPELFAENPDANPQELISGIVNAREDNVFSIFNSARHLCELKAEPKHVLSFRMTPDSDVLSEISLDSLTLKDGTTLADQFASGRGITWVSGRRNSDCPWTHKTPLAAWNETSAMFRIVQSPYGVNLFYGFGFAGVSECFGDDGEPVSVLPEPKIKQGHQYFFPERECPIAVMPLAVIAPAAALTLPTSAPVIVLVDVSNEKAISVRKRCSALLEQTLGKYPQVTDAVVSLFDKKWDDTVSFEETIEAVQHSVDDINACNDDGLQVTLVTVSADELNAIMSPKEDEALDIRNRELQTVFKNAVVYDVASKKMCNDYPLHKLLALEPECKFGAIISKFTPSECDCGKTSVRNSTALCLQLAALKAIPSDIDNVVCIKSSDVSSAAAKEISKVFRVLYSDIPVENAVYSGNDILRSKKSFFIFDEKRFPRISEIAERFHDDTIAEAIFDDISSHFDSIFVMYEDGSRCIPDRSEMAFLASRLTNGNVTASITSTDISQDDMQAFLANTGKENQPLWEVATKYGTTSNDIATLEGCLELWRDYVRTTGVNLRIKSPITENNIHLIIRTLNAISAEFGLSASMDAVCSGCSVEDVSEIAW